MDLINELPIILTRGKKEAQKILDVIHSRNKIILQTNELVLPTKTKNWFKEELNKKDWLNRIIYGDNLLIMQALLAGDLSTGIFSLRGKIDLIYIDPPFDSKADYRTKIHLFSTEIESRPTIIEQFAYADTWKNGTVSYLEMMVPRLILMKELLSEQGSIYVHIDWHVGHYIKIIMDNIFGKENFRNEIITKKITKNLQNQFKTIYSLPQGCDFILHYTKSTEKKFKPLRVEKKEILHPEGYWKDFWNNADRPTMRYNLLGVVPFSGQWKWKQDRALKAVENYSKWIKENKISEISLYLYWTKNPDMEFVRLSKTGKVEHWIAPDSTMIKSDLWDDIQSQDTSIDYDTAKNPKIIERIINYAAENDSIIADFFAGSGTTGVVAEKLGKKWILSDLGKPACMIMRKRLIDQNANPFLYQSIGDYQKEQFEKSSFKSLSDLAQVVVNLFGAMNFPTQDTPNNLGYIKQSRILVFVDSPSKLTGFATLKKAQSLRGSFMGGWNKVVVLGWNFVTDIGRIIENLADEKLEVLVIPPDLLDRLKTKGSYEQLIKSGKIRFSSLQYLTVKPIKKKDNNGEEELDIELKNYVLLSPDALPLDEKNKEELEKVIEKDPLSLIEYWSIDPDYDGEVFKSKWQEYREDNEDLMINRKVRLVVPKVKGERKVFIKAVDIFGFESAIIQRLNNG